MAATVTFTATLCNVKVLFTFISSDQKQNGYRGFCTPLDHPFSRLQSCVAVSDRRIRHQRLSYDVLHQRCLPRSHRSLSRLLSWSSLLVLPPFQDMIHFLQAPRRFLVAPREQGFWEKGVCLLWRNMGKMGWLGTKLLPTAFQNVKWYNLVSLPDLWQVFWESHYQIATTTCPSKEDGHCIALTSFS